MFTHKLALFFLLFILIPFCLISEELNIIIMDKDLEIPLEGVQITSTGFEGAYFTDEEGRITIPLEDSTGRIIILCSLIGYEIKKVLVKEFDKELLVQMVIEGVIEGDELVVEEEYYEKEDKIGTSLVIDEEELKTMAMRGIFEDVLTAATIMPGVSYSSNFFTEITVRGGYPRETVATFDGFLVRVPLYWGGSYSIFNPNIVDSSRFNNGVFNVKYGQAISGLLEVNTKIPNEGFKFHFKTVSTSVEFFTQFPINSDNTAGILLGGRFTYLELTLKNLWKAMDLYVKRTPYIYEGNFKLFWQPQDRFTWYLNGFCGMDGVGMGADYSDEMKGSDLENDFFFYNDNYHVIGFTGFKIMPGKRTFIHFYTGYEYYGGNYEDEFTQRGTFNYSEEFVETFPDLGFTTDDTYTINFDRIDEYRDSMHSSQSRLDIDLELSDKAIFSLGGGLIYDFMKMKQEAEYFDMWEGMYITEEYQLDNYQMFNSSGYMNLSLNIIPEKLEIETGVRLDHHFSLTEGHLINTTPAVSPRFYLAYTPVRNKKSLDYFTVSFGCGLYSRMPDYRYYYDINGNVPESNLKQEKCLTNIIGFEWLFPAGIMIKLEGYYKYYFHRFYANQLITDEGEEYSIVHTDGLGHVGGFDVTFKKKISRILDGQISYTFIYARYFLPESDGLSNTDGGEPRGEWYYPYFHRFHSFSFLINIKPARWLTLTLSGGLHSGLPETTYTNIRPNYTDMGGGNVIERWEADSIYGSERTAISIPFNIRISFHGYFRNSKVQYEVYLTSDNIFSFIYDPDRGKYFNAYTGELLDMGKASYEVYMFSLGFMISY
jgi:hypothetical protein